MGIILSKLPYPKETMHNSTSLVSMNETKLSDTHREFAVRVLACLVNQTASRTIHRLYRITGIVNSCKVHILFIIVPMAALMPQLLVENYGRADFFIFILIVNATPKVHYCIPDNHPFRMNECKARAGFVEAE